jgi:hypothetical protein
VRRGASAHFAFADSDPDRNRAFNCTRPRCDVPCSPWEARDAGGAGPIAQPSPKNSRKVLPGRCFGRRLAHTSLDADDASAGLLRSKKPLEISRGRAVYTRV